MPETPTAADVYEVPDTVWDRVALGVTAQDSHAAAQGGAYEVTSLVERGVRIASPLAAAVELRRIADAQDAKTSVGVIFWLRARADELDPPARQED